MNYKIFIGILACFVCLSFGAKQVSREPMLEAPSDCKTDTCFREHPTVHFDMPLKYRQKNF